MKVVFVVVALFGLVHCDNKCTSSSSPSLEDDFNDITKLIPTEKVKKVTQKYSNDNDVKEIHQFLQNATFASTFKHVMSEKVVQDLVKFLCANGVTMVEHINKVNDLLGFPQIGATPVVSRDSEPGVRTFKAQLQEIEALLPLAQMKAVFEQKKKSSVAFKALYDKIHSKEFAAMIQEIKALPSNQQGNEFLAQHGVDVKDLFRVIQELIGWVEVYEP